MFVGLILAWLIFWLIGWIILVLLFVSFKFELISLVLGVEIFVIDLRDLVYFGLMMRSRLAPMAAGLDQLESEGATPELDIQLAQSVARARPFMFAAWLSLALAAGLGTPANRSVKVE